MLRRKEQHAGRRVNNRIFVIIYGFRVPQVVSLEIDKVGRPPDFGVLILEFCVFTYCLECISQMP